MALTKVIGAGLGKVASSDLDGAVTINESSADVDFRVESNGNANMLFVDGGNDRVGIGTSSPAFMIQVDNPVALSGSGNDYYLAVGNTSSNSRRAVALGVDGVFGNAVIAGYNTFSPGLGDLIIDGLQIKNRTNGTDRIKIASNGDISFYEDTGTTPKMFWDSSAESLGIGTSSPASALHIDAADSATGGFRMKNTAGESVELYYASSSADADFIINRTGSGAADIGLKHTGDVYFTSGNVGIGTSSPQSKLDIITSSTGGLNIEDGTVKHSLAGANITVYQGSENTNVRTLGIDAQQFIVRTGVPQGTSTSERMRIDSSGNVGIGTSSPSTLLMVEPSARTTNFSASDYTTYADILVKNPTDDSTCATGIAFITDATTYTNGASGIACVSGSGDSESSLAFITRPLNAVAAERMRITSAGNVGIGTTLPQVPLNVAGVSGTAVLRLSDSTSTSTTDAAPYMEFYRGIGDALLGRIGYLSTANKHLYLYNDQAGNITLGTSGTERMKIDSSGNVILPNDASDFTFNTNSLHIGAGADIKIGHTSNNNGILSDNGMPFTIFTDVFRVNSADNSENLFGADKNSSFFAKFDNSTKIKTVSNGIEVTGGVYLGGTGSANLLDDYEEGTWTPTVDSGTIIVASGSARYIKIGNLVTCYARISNFSDSTGGTSLKIKTLPFTINTLNTDANVGNAWGNAMGNEPCMFFFSQTNDTKVVGYYGASGDAAYNQVIHSDFTSATNMIIKLTYMTA